MEYFVFYSYLTDTENGFGNCSVNRDRPIQSLEDVREVEREIRKTFEENGCANPNIVIVNWKGFEHE